MCTHTSKNYAIVQVLVEEKRLVLYILGASSLPKKDIQRANKEVKHTLEDVNTIHGVLQQLCCNLMLRVIMFSIAVDSFSNCVDHENISSLQK